MTKKLLIVDDSQASRTVIRNLITRHRRDWSVFESDNGFDAIDMASVISPDYVTMDVNMPAMSGLDAAEKILKVIPAVRVALLTANVQELTRKRALELGIGFVEKPVNEQRIEQVLRHFEQGSGDAR